MVVKVYTGSEVAEMLRITEGELIELVQSGELQAFGIKGLPRITEDALESFMSKPFSLDSARPVIVSPPAHVTPDRPTVLHLSPLRTTGQRNRDPQAAKALRTRITSEVSKLAPDFRWTGRSSFRANGRVGVLALATMRSGLKPDFWLGFTASFLSLAESNQVFIVVALRDGTQEHVFVVPYAKHRETIDNLSLSATGKRQFHVDNPSGEYLLTGKSNVPEIRLGVYEGDFSAFGP